MQPKPPPDTGPQLNPFRSRLDNMLNGIDALHGVPFDGHTLKRSIGQAEQLTGWTVTDVFFDRGTKGQQHTLPEKTVHMTARKNKPI